MAIIISVLSFRKIVAENQVYRAVKISRGVSILK